MAEEISARELWEPQRGAAILTLLHTLLHSNGQMMSWVQEYTSLKSREVYPPMGDGEGRQSICRTIRVPLQRYVWDHICVYSHFRRQEEIGWTQSNHCLPKQWTCGQKMGFCLILLLALAFCGERLHVRRAVLEFSPPLLPLVLAAFVLLPVTWQPSLTHPFSSQPSGGSSRSLWIDGEQRLLKQLDVNVNTRFEAAAEFSSLLSFSPEL